MKIRDSFAALNNECSGIEMPSGGLEVVADDGRALFSIRLADDGTLEISGGSFCKHGGRLLEETIAVMPRASNLVYVRKERHEA